MSATQKLKITQVRSPIGRPAVQRQTLIGLGLNKMRRSRVHDDTREVRGMIDRVAHLVTVAPATDADLATATKPAAKNKSAKAKPGPAAAASTKTVDRKDKAVRVKAGPKTAAKDVEADSAPADTKSEEAKSNEAE